MRRVMAGVSPQSVRPTTANSSMEMSMRWQVAHTSSWSRITQIALAFAISLAVLGRGINAPFIKDAEPQSAQWIADIVSNGNWLLPHDYYHLVNRKPPLFYWLSAIVAKTSRGQVDEVRARAVSLAAGAALAAEVMAWTAARLGPCGGWLAFVFLLGTYGFAARATAALTDMLLTFLLFSTYVVLTLQIDGADSWWRAVTAGVLLGLAILTKGPVAAVLLALAVFIYLLLRRANLFHPLMRAWPWAVFTLSLGIACTWYVPAFIAGRAANLGEVFFQENLGHFLPSNAGGTGEAARPAYYIGLRIIGGSLPLSLLLPAVVLSCRDYTRHIRRDLLYQLAMVLAVLLLFSMASAKRDDYILPALPPLAILFAAQFVCLDGADSGEAAAVGEVSSARHSDSAYGRQSRDNGAAAHARSVKNGRLAATLRDTAVCGSAAAILVGTLAIFIFVRNGGALSILGSRLTSSDASYTAIFAYGLARLTPPFMAFSILVIVCASAALAGVWYARPLISGAGFGLLCVAGSSLWIGTVKPIEASTRSVARFTAKVRAQVGNAPIYVARPDPELSWYYGYGIPVIPGATAIWGPPSGMKVYFAGRPDDLAIIAPRVRKHMRLIIQSHVMGAGGPPALYLLQSSN
jgi:Dolichyl-phosphate-mannose-protein mannosyltransferase